LGGLIASSPCAGKRSSQVFTFTSRSHASPYKRLLSTSCSTKTSNLLDSTSPTTLHRPQLYIAHNSTSPTTSTMTPRALQPRQSPHQLTRQPPRSIGEFSNGSKITKTTQDKRTDLVKKRRNGLLEVVIPAWSEHMSMYVPVRTSIAYTHLTKT
jgi:hypothetical protein